MVVVVAVVVAAAAAAAAVVPVVVVLLLSTAELVPQPDTLAREAGIPSGPPQESGAARDGMAKLRMQTSAVGEAVD